MEEPNFPPSQVIKELTRFVESHRPHSSGLCPVGQPDRISIDGQQSMAIKAVKQVGGRYILVRITVPLPNYTESVLVCTRAGFERSQ